MENIILSYLTHTGVCDIPLSYDFSDVTIALNILVSGGMRIPVQKANAPDQREQMKNFVVITTDLISQSFLITKIMHFQWLKKDFLIFWSTGF